LSGAAMQREKKQEDADEYEGSCLLLHIARICWFTHTIWFTQGNRLIVTDHWDIPDKWIAESCCYIVDRNKIELDCFAGINIEKRLLNCKLICKFLVN